MSTIKKGKTVYSLRTGKKMKVLSIKKVQDFLGRKTTLLNCAGSGTREKFYRDEISVNKPKKIKFHLFS